MANIHTLLWLLFVRQPLTHLLAARHCGHGQVDCCAARVEPAGATEPNPLGQHKHRPNGLVLSRQRFDRTLRNLRVVLGHLARRTQRIPRDSTRPFVSLPRELVGAVRTGERTKPRYRLHQPRQTNQTIRYGLISVLRRVHR